MGIEMTKTHTKKGEVKPLIFEALKEYRSIPEVKRYIRKKFGSDKEPSERTIYHHINKIKKESKNDNSQYQIDNIGNKYRITKKEEKENKDISDEHLKWFMERYRYALNEKDQSSLYWLRNELYELCFNNIKNKEFLDFIFDLVKKDSYEYYENLGLDMGNMTFKSWSCLGVLSRYKNNNYIQKRIFSKDITNFFKNIIMDYDRKYAEERIKAWQQLGFITNFKELLVPLQEFLLNMDTKRKVVFSPNKFLKTNEYDLFEERMKFTIHELAIWKPYFCRKFLFDIYLFRKDKFGTDRCVSMIKNEAERIRSSDFKVFSEGVKETDNEMRKLLKENPELRKDLFPWEDD